MKYLLAILFFSSAIFMYGQTTTFVIDPAIKEEVEKRIEFIPPKYKLEDYYLIYKNTSDYDSYQADTLLYSSPQNDMELFRSCYGWSNDTLKIEGLFGLSKSAGFSMYIADGKAQLYHLVETEFDPNFANTASGRLEFSIEVPCTEVHITLSEIPDPVRKDTLYGYVDFKSADYFSCMADKKGEDLVERKKWRADMRIYFMSGFFDLNNRPKQED